jgi:DNA gyrase subunit A
VRTKVDGISVIGRNTQGVRCIALNEGDKLVSVALIPNEEPEESVETAAAPTPGPSPGPAPAPEPTKE